MSRTLRHSNISITDKFYSDYVLDDLVETINDSPIIKNSLTPDQLIDKGIKAFQKAIGNDQRVVIKINKDNNENMGIKTFLR